MYKRILVPTDGSKLSHRGVKAGVALAKALGATVVGYHAVEPPEHIYQAIGAGARPSQVDAIDRQLREQGEGYLEQIRKTAAAAGVACETLVTNPTAPWQGIIEAARSKRCDAICIASHGRGFIASALLGNVAHKVLTHSKLPVLVCR
jgi:nucleotide-binding universal stress UspA family protein